MNSAPPAPCRVREATANDLDFIVGANLAMALETEQKTLVRETLRNGVQAVLEDPHRGFYLVAESESGDRFEPVGCLMITREWSDWRAGFFWWIQSVYVDGHHRGKGVYSALHREVERRGRATEEVCGIRLYVDHQNHVARQVYHSLGMTSSDYLLMEQGL